MCIYHIESAPVPLLNIHATLAVLVISGNHEAPSGSRELRSDIQRLLGSNTLYYALKTVSGFAAARLLQRAPGLVQADQFRCSKPLRGFQRKRASRYGHNASARAHAQPCEHRSQESDSHNRNALTRRDLASPEDVHCAGKGLAGKRLVGQLRRNSDERIGTREIVFRVGSLREQGHALANLEFLDIGTYRINGAPALVAG